MSRRSNADQNFQMLQRIVAFLFALAELAQKAASMPRPMRKAVCWILSLPESMIRDLVFDFAHDLNVEADLSRLETLEDGDSTADLMRLALAYYEMGQMLGMLVAYAQDCELQARVQSVGVMSSLIEARFRILVAAMHRVSTSSAPYHDTS